MKKYNRCISEIRELKGVKDVREPHFWDFHSGSTIGSVHIEIDTEAAEQEILREAHAIFRSCDVGQMTIQIHK